MHLDNFLDKEYKKILFFILNIVFILFLVSSEYFKNYDYKLRVLDNINNVEQNIFLLEEEIIKIENNSSITIIEKK